ncbi:hypothetical protein pA_gene0058 [Vibrio phage 13VT501A]|nr:hypothetical protein pA_gene0058 [Vibrio phage 13VT501A]
MRLFKGDCYVEFVLDTGETLAFDDINEEYGRRLDVDFNCLKTQSSHPNKSSARIYGINESNRNLITSRAKKIRLFAGYDVLKLIATGDIVISTPKYEQPDWSIEVIFGDGQSAYQNSRTTISFSEGTSVKDIISKLSQNMGLAIRQLPDQLKESINSGLSLSGLTKDAMDIITKDFGLDWSIQDDEIVVTQSDKSANYDIVVINGSSGLIGTPLATPTGVNFTAQLNPDIRPKGIIEINSDSWSVDNGQSAIAINDNRKFNGKYQVRNVTYSGNNYGGPFEVMVEAVIPPGGN